MPISPAPASAPASATALGHADAHLDGWPAAIEVVLRDPGRIAVHFQPIVDPGRGVIAGFEALPRFAADPPVGPDRWFAAARLLGREPELEAAVLARRSTRVGSCRPPS